MKGVLLVNLGSPDTPEPADVKNYLREFLMDERVIDFLILLKFIGKRNYFKYKTKKICKGL